MDELLAAGKAFAGLRAEFALRGCMLERTDPMDGHQRFYVTQSGVVRRVDSLGAVRELLAALPSPRRKA